MARRSGFGDRPEVPAWRLVIGADAVTLLDEDADIVRVILPREAWPAFADPLAFALNERLSALKLPRGTWGRVWTRLDRLLGTEVCVLLWAIGPADAALFPVIFEGWRALRPEERWWLYSMGRASPAWRRAVAIGLGAE